MRSSRRSPTALVLAAGALVAGVAGPPALAAFASQAESAANLVTAAADFRPPQVTAAALGKTSGGATGFVRQGGAYYVYANVAADTGNPASGTDTVTADVAGLTAGATAVPLVAGSYGAGGIAYGYRSAALTADAPLAEGSRPFAVTATDNALNAATLGGSAVVDNTPPQGVDVQAANANANGLAEQGDSLTLAFGEPVEPHSILAGWGGAATSVVVRINDNGLLGLPTGNDTLQVFDSANKTALPLGTVDLGRGDYAAGALGGTIRFGVSGTPSTMTMSGNAVTIALGTYATPGLLEAFRTTASGTSAMAWTPAPTPYDRAGNPATTAAAAESGAADKEF